MKVKRKYKLDFMRIKKFYSSNDMMIKVNSMADILWENTEKVKKGHKVGQNICQAHNSKWIYIKNIYKTNGQKV